MSTLVNKEIAMSEQKYGPYVQSFRVFWKALQSWVKAAIFLVGLIIGTWVWFTGLSASFPLIALIFLGANTAALIVKILVGIAVIAAFVVAVAIAIWLVGLIVYGLSYMIMNNENASMGELIFKTKK